MRMLKALKIKPWRKTRSIPDGLRIYAIGDVHGNADALRDVFARIDADKPKWAIRRSIQIYLGDYVDRGPASREVLDLLAARSRTDELVLLKGNHEAMLLEFLSDPSMLRHWRQYGGLQTIMSYGLKPSLNPSPEEQRELARGLAERMSTNHRELIASMQTCTRFGDFFFVHAGVRPRVPLKDQKEEDLLWIRDEFLLHERDFEKIIVHGHTPVAEPEVHSNRINLDVGAYATGRLACLVIDGETIDFI
jgi:serine/threonine protein phosphatase 1